MPPRPHLAVKVAQKATTDDLLDRLKLAYKKQGDKNKRLQVELARERRSADLSIHTTKTLSVAQKTWIWDLFERNMRTLYESSGNGYDPDDKRKELFHADSRFLLLDSVTSSPASAAESPLGFCIFRFDTEETASEEEGADELCDVAYCYELQVDATAQGQGVGRALVEALEKLAKAYRMDKTMLTVFKANTQAVGFYEKIGYGKDEIDPSLYGLESEVDYMILSKDCT
ncbi:hypothetical protein JCM11641_007193 [Rhodosporidiobolus odoratus]